MTMLANLKIPTKILLLLLMLGAVTVGVAVWGSRSVAATDASYSVMVDEAKAPLYLARANQAVAAMMYDGYRSVVYDGATRESRAAAESEQADYDAAKAALAKAVAAKPALKSQVVEFDGQLDAVHLLTKQATKFGLADNDTAATAVLAKADVKLADLKQQIKATNDAAIAASDVASAALTTAANAASFWLLAISITGVVISMGIGMLVSRIGITGPLNKLRGTMDRLAAGETRIEVAGAARGDEVGTMAKTVLIFRDAAVALEAATAEKMENDSQRQQVVETMSTGLASLSDGDLTSTIDREFPREFEGLKSNFNTALLKLRALIGGVTDSADGIRTGSAEIAQASEDLARRTEGNAASLEETSAALAQIDTRLKATALSSTQTVSRADQAIATVGGGRSTAVEAVAAMGRVSDSAKGIDSVIEGLDKIAFQTRVLAMNAAVEAGRAGDAGRGFAVVADLVSALAMRAEEEAKRARDQLTVTQTDIVTAVQAVQKVDGALANISSDVGEVHKLLGTMANDATAQSSAITQIAAAISSMDQSTQQNAAMVEETSAAARNLTAEVASLAEQAAMFKTDTAAAGRRAPPARIAPPTRNVPLSAKAKRNAVAAGYTSPVKALPAMANASAGSDDWNDF